MRARVAYLIGVCACGPSVGLNGDGAEEGTTSTTADVMKPDLDVPSSSDDLPDPCAAADATNPIPVKWRAVLPDGSSGGIAADDSGNIFSAYGLGDFDRDALRSRVTRFAPDGTEIWSVDPPGRVREVVAAEQGRLFLAGEDEQGDVVLALNADGNELWTWHPHDGFVRDFDVLAASDARAVVVGHCALTLDACAVVLDDEGNESLRRSFASSAAWRGAAVSERGWVALVGWTSGDADHAWVALHDDEGELVWRREGPVGSFAYVAVAFQSDDTVVATGVTYDDSRDHAVVHADQYTIEGDAGWSWASAPLGYAEILDITVTSSGGSVISGTGAITQPSAEADGRVWLLDDDGELVASSRYAETTYKFQHTDAVAVDPEGHIVSYSWGDVAPDDLDPQLAQDGIVRRHCPL